MALDIYVDEYGVSNKSSFEQCICCRVETGSGHLGYPGHILSRSSRSHLFYIILGLIQILHWITCICPCQGDELSILEGDSGSISP